MELARKVFISSDMAHDERLVEVAEECPEAALLWPWILTYLDDWGRGLAAARRIKAAVFGANPAVTVELIERAIALYERVGLIQVYEVSGRRYMAVPADRWFKWQTHIPSEKRLSEGSEFPPPPDHDEAVRRILERDATGRVRGRSTRVEQREGVRANSDTPTSARASTVQRGSADVSASTRNCAQVSAVARDPAPSLSPSPSGAVTEEDTSPSLCSDEQSSGDGGASAPPSPRRRSSQVRYTDDERRVVERLRAAIEETGVKVFPRDWHLRQLSVVRQMIRADPEGCSPERIIECIEWMRMRAFWQRRLAGFGMSAVRHAWAEFLAERRVPEAAAACPGGPRRLTAEDIR